MHTTRYLAWVLVAAAAAVPGGCSSGAGVHRQAQQTYARLLADQEDPPVASAAEAAEPESGMAVLYFAPRAEPAPLDGADPAPAARDETAALPASAAPGGSLAGKTSGEIIQQDLMETPAKVWNGMKLSFGNPTNLALLAGAYGIDRIVWNNVDLDVNHEMKHERTSLRATGAFGEIVGHPGLHLAAAAAWYLASVEARDEKNHELSKVMIEALAVNDITTQTLQMAVNQRDPRGYKYGWPSGHTSSSFCVASVLHEYYGWEVGVPAYLLAGYIGATRVADRKHNVSDIVFGTALGLVVGHSVARGELPQVGGFNILPYGGADGGGVMLVRQW